MAFRFCDGFDSYASGSDLVKKWSIADASFTWSNSAGRFGGGAVANAGAAGGKQLQKLNIAASVSDMAAGFYLKASAAPAAAGIVLNVVNSAGASVGDISLNTAGTCSLHANSNSLQATSSINVCDGAWHWIEFRLQWGNPSYLYVDNVQQGTGGGGNLGNNYASVYLQSVAGITTTWDDVVVYDSTTGAPTPASNFPINARQITTLRPTSDSVVGFGTTSSGSTHYNLVNETVPDGDTSYVQDGGSGTQDLLNFASLGYTPTAINVVILNVYSDNPAGGTINIQGIAKNSISQANGSAIVSPLVYQTNQWPFALDPYSGVAWVAAGVNAAQFGYKNA
jgi:hypothetical protein